MKLILSIFIISLVLSQTETENVLLKQTNLTNKILNSNKTLILWKRFTWVSILIFFLANQRFFLLPF